MKLLNGMALVLAVTAVAGCSSFNLFKDTSAPDTSVAAAPQVPATPGGVMSAAQIKALLTGKSWRWQGPRNAGVTLYASDGTSLVEVTGKGTTQGKWRTMDGMLCESFSPAAFLPQGDPEHCQPFTGTNGSYMVGQTTFQLAT